MNAVTIEPDLVSLLNKLTVEIENDAKELEIRKKRIDKNEALRRAIQNSLGSYKTETDASRYGARSTMVLDAIKALPSAQFTQDDVEAEIKRMSPTLELNAKTRNRVRAALWALASKHRIKTVRRGNNSQPAIYERADANKAPNPTERHSATHQTYSGMTQPAAILKALGDHGPQTTRELFDRLNAGGMRFKRTSYLTAILSRLRERVEKTVDGKMMIKR